MIRNGSKNRKHRDKPYQRVHVPPDIINQLDTLVGETSPSRASGSSGAANEPPQREGGTTRKLRDKRVMFSSPGLASTQRARAAGDQSMPDPFPVDSDSPGPSRNTVPTAEDSDDEEVIIGAAYRIATEPEVSPSEGGKSDPSLDPTGGLVYANFKPCNERAVRHVQPPSSLENDFASPFGQPSSSRRPGYATSIPRPSNALDVEQLRLELREAFDDFLTRATAVMNQHLEKLQQHN